MAATLPFAEQWPTTMKPGLPKTTMKSGMVPALGGPERKLGESALCWGLSWSPDGRFLALVNNDSPQARPGIFLLNIETGEKRRITTPAKEYSGDIEPHFSSNG
jgi:hypothetical protein